MTDLPHHRDVAAASGGHPSRHMRRVDFDPPVYVDMPVLSRTWSETRHRMPVYLNLDLADVVAGLETPPSDLRVAGFGSPAAAPPAVVTCVRRLLELALAGFGPPVTDRVDVRLGFLGAQLGLRVVAADRHSFSRMMRIEERVRAVEEITTWCRAFSGVYSMDPLRGGRANVAAVIPFVPRWEPPWQHLGFGGRGQLSRRYRCKV